MDIFVSYSRKQRATVERIVDRLRQLGFSVWFDASMEAGVRFGEEIHRELKDARAVLVCWTHDALKSEWVTGEAEIGRSRDVLVSALLEPLQLRPPFNVRQAVDLTAWNGDSADQTWLQLVDKLRQLAGNPQRPVGPLEFGFLPPVRFGRVPPPRAGERWTAKTTIRADRSTSLFQRRGDFMVSRLEWMSAEDLLFATGQFRGMRCWSAQGREVVPKGQKVTRASCTALAIDDLAAPAVVATACRAAFSESVLSIWRNDKYGAYDPQVVIEHPLPDCSHVIAMAWQPGSRQSDPAPLAVVVKRDKRLPRRKDKPLPLRKWEHEFEVSVWDVDKVSQRWRHTCKGPFRVQWSPDGKYLATPMFSGKSFELFTSDGDQIDFRTCEKDNPVWFLRRPRAGFAWHPGSRFFATGISDREVGVFDVQSLQRVRTVILGDTHRSDGTDLQSIQWSPDGRHLLAATAVGTMVVTNLERGGTSEFYATGAAPSDLNFSPDGQRVAIPGDRGLRIYHPLSSGEELALIPIENVSTIRWHPDSARVAIAHAEYNSRVSIAELAV